MSNLIYLNPVNDEEKDLIAEYQESISRKAKSTVDVYIRIISQFASWLASKHGEFSPSNFTRTAVDTYLDYLNEKEYSISHQNRVKTTLSGFAKWLIDEKELLNKNPTTGLDIPAQSMMAPRQLTDEQRYILRSLVEKEGTVRGQAIFSLGYWAGCRVSDVSWLLLKNVNVGRKIGTITVGHKGGKERDLDIINEVRGPLYDYIHSGDRQKDSPYVFTSQRSERLTEHGIHHWFRNLKAMATKNEWPEIEDLTFHDLRHDFAHRAREVGWGIEELAFYLGHITKKGTPAIQTTVRYTQVGREQIKNKLRLLKG